MTRRAPPWLPPQPLPFVFPASSDSSIHWPSACSTPVCPLGRTTPVALVEVKGRRWIIGTFGEVNWVRNLRAAGEATLKVGGGDEEVAADELTAEEATEFFSDVLGPYVRGVPLGRWMLRSILGAGDILEDPALASRRHPVFELRPKA